MQISSRFTEYGLTGGFFWICQLILLWYSGKIQLLLSNLPIVHIPNEISQIASAAVTGLLGALVIFSVFVAGLLLDLSAVIFRPVEMRVFHRNLERNRSWLGRLIDDHKGYCGADYEEFERRFGGSSYFKDQLAKFNIFFFWNRERRQRYLDAVERDLGGRLTRPYERLWSFLASYVVVVSGSSQLGLMLDQYHLWRTGRAISIALYIVFFEVQLFIVIPSTLHLTSHMTEPSFLVPLVGSFFPLCGALLATAITLGTYSRLCYTLFALVYVTQDKRNEEVKNRA